MGKKLEAPNYIQSEFGKLPIDWSVKKFSEVMDGFSSGATPYRGNPEYYKGKIRWITSGELNYSIIYDTQEKITEEAVKKTNLTIHPKGTFLIAITGLEAEGTRGRCGIIGAESTTNQSCMALYPKDSLVLDYLYHYYISKSEYFALKYCQGTKQQSYTAKLVRNLPIVLPSCKDEQIKISEILNDINKLIKSLDILIKKKQNIKKGTIQQLIRGKRRLNNFNENWTVKSLGDVLKVKHGKSQHDILDENGRYPILATSGEIGRTNSYLYDKPSVLIGRKGTINKPQFVDSPFWTIDTLFYTEIKSQMDPKFIFYLFQDINWIIYNEASGVPSLSASTIEKIEREFPANMEEQIQISQIISFIDNEVKFLKKLKNKYILIKKGMMQQLLTGKVRLL